MSNAKVRHRRRRRRNRAWAPLFVMRGDSWTVRVSVSRELRLLFAD